MLGPFGCSGGACLACAVNADCGSGRWCSSGTCLNCNDTVCGATCQNCSATGDVCNDCVDCVVDATCGGGAWCSTNVCTACTSSAHCGSSCVNCGSGSQCTGSPCAVCNTAAACGAGCPACGGSTPLCLDQGTSSICVACRTTADCTGGNTCNLGTHSCSSSTCALPAAACTLGSESRVGCANARTISRKDAAAAGYSISPSLCSASNASDVAGCSDSGHDHTWRIFLRAGEQMVLNQSALSDCAGGTWFGTFKILQSLGCADTTCPTLSYCATNVMRSTNKTFTATQDGWYFIVADAGASGDGALYHIGVTLTCNVAGCECP